MTSPPWEAALAGDQDAFASLVEPFRRELHVHCYRILGSLDDADDLVQETMVAAWQGLPGFAGRSSLRTWLYRIATTRCLNAVRNQSRRPRPAPAPPFLPPPPTDHFDLPHLQPYSDRLLEELDPALRAVARESVELAFVSALQRMPPRQAATLVLRDVLGYSISEVGGMLETTSTATKGLLQRARASVPRRVPVANEAAAKDVARRFADAYSRDDIDGVLKLLTDQSWLAMPPAAECYVGLTSIGDFLRASAAGRPGGTYTLVETSAAAQPAFICYLENRARGLLVLTPAGDGETIASIMRFLDDGLHRHFSVPDSLA